MGATPRRRYFNRMMAAVLAYGLSIALASTVIQRHEVTGPLALAAAAVPGLAIIGMFWALGLYIVELKDEFMRMLLVRQHLIAMGFTMSVASVWGFLEMFGQVERVDTFWIVIVWAFGTVVGGLANRITHGTWGECL